MDKKKGPGRHGFGWPAGPPRPPTRPEVGSPNTSFSTGFIRFSAMAGSNARNSEKPNAFLILLRVILQKGHQMYQETTGLYGFLWTFS